MATVNKIYKFVSEEKFGSVDSSTSFPEILEKECHELKSSEIREGTGFDSNVISKMNLIGILNFVFFFENISIYFLTCFFLFDLPFLIILKNNAKNFSNL